MFLEEYRNDVDIMYIGVRFTFLPFKKEKRGKKKGAGFYDLT